jgi:uncharacterized membrane protein HdeD (DUF308 family)
MPRMDMDKKHWLMHKRWMGGKLLILGLLILANMYWGFLNWIAFIGIILGLWGLIELIMPGCKMCR